MLNNNHPLSWVVVADNCQARIYRVAKFPKLEEVSFLEHPDSHLHNQDLVSSKPGSSMQKGGAARYSYQPKTEPKSLEAAKFATELCNFLSSSLREGAYNRLYIMAEPSFLGLLRQHMSGDIKKTVIAEIAKELTSRDAATIEKHLAEI